MENDNSQTLVVHPREGEFVLTNWDGVSFLKDGEIIDKDKFDHLSCHYQAIIVTVKHNTPRQFQATE